MELGLREWLIIGGAIVVLLIVLDGWRRMRGSGNRLKMKIDKSFSDIPDVPEESFNPELPGGGARVVGRAAGTTDSATDARREPVFGNDELDLSLPRTANLVAEEPGLDKPLSKYQTAQEPLTSGSGTVPQVPGSSRTFTKPSWKKKSVEQKSEHISPTFSEDEHDPLFASSDSFPPHHDGPSFDEMDEGVSAVRVVRVADPAPLPEQEEPQPPVVIPEEASVDEAMIPVVKHIADQPEIAAEEEEASVEYRSGAEPESSESESDEPDIHEFDSTDADTIETEDAEPEDSEPETVELFPVDEDESDSAPEYATAQPEAAYSAEDDDLIDSLPEGFRTDSVSESDDDEDDHGFDYTRPVSELMRPVREDNNQLQQAAMDLPEHQESIFSLIDEPATASQSPSERSGLEQSELKQARAEQKPEPEIEPEHFSATRDEPGDLADGFFVDEPASPSSEKAAEKPVEKAETSDSAIGIKGQSLQKIPEADKVLVISVVAAEGGESFSGRSLLQILLACGMRYGDMKIFHRYEDGIDQGAIQFSMTNALEPGYFDIDTMDNMETRGVTFFMSMEEPRDVMNAYECMLATAVAVAKNLHGVLLDENRSTMRDQTKEHYRERIRTFEMRKLKKTTTA